ncbi:MAG: hypothetical protein U1E62_18955 [Alsobacter sp.]
MSTLVPDVRDTVARRRAVGAALGLALAVTLAVPATAEAKGRGGHLIHRIFPGTFAAGEGKPARLAKARICRTAWQASLTPERPSYIPYASFRKAHCAPAPRHPGLA